MKRSLRRPSLALVVACVALFVALGGVGYAAMTIPRNSVGTPQLKREAVTSAKLKDRGVKSKDIGAGQVRRVHVAFGTRRGTYGIAGVQPHIAYAGVSFPLRFAPAQGPVAQFIPSGGPTTAQCSGSPANPTAAPGYLCFYESFGFNRTMEICDGAGGCASGEVTVSPWGAILRAVGSAVGANFGSRGSWAVTR